MSFVIARANSFRSKILAQIGRRDLGLALDVEGRHEASFLVHQIDDRAVVHGVVAAVERHFLVVGAVSLGDGGERVGVAGEAAQVRIEAPEIVLEGGRRIALGIDGDEERGGAVRVAPERTTSRMPPRQSARPATKAPSTRTRREARWVIPDVLSQKQSARPATIISWNTALP